MNQRESLQNQILVVKDLLAELELRRAGFGELHVPAHIIIEIKAAEKKIAKLEAELQDIISGNLPRARNNPLHQLYLSNLVESIGVLNLAVINPDQSGNVYLDEVYVDSPTSVSISVEVKGGQVVDWWLPRPGESYREKLDERIAPPRPRPEELGYTRAPFEGLVNKIDPRKNNWKAGVKENIIQLHLNHLAAACNRLVILGAPGSGKSTFVRYLALCLAGAELEDWERKANLAELENWPHGALTPIYIELRRFVVSTHFPPGGAVTAEHLWNYVVNELLGKDLQEYAGDLKNELKQGQAVLLLDGLDEVPFEEGKLKERQEQIIGLVQSLNKQFKGSRVIVTSRPSAYEGWSLPGFETVQITAFGDEHRLKLVERLYRATKMSAAVAQTKAKALNQQLKGIDQELKDRPLFVTLMATLYLKGEEVGLPTRKGTLYRESILLLLDRWTRSKPGAPSLLQILGDKTVEDLYVRLAALAFAVHDNSVGDGRTAEIREGLLLEYLKPFGDYRRMHIIHYLCENAGVLLAPGQRGNEEIFHFAHRTFEEYLAAAHLVKLYEKEESFRQVREVIIGKPETWRVPCGFVGDVLSDTGRKIDLWQLLAELLEEEPPKRGEDPRWWLVWLGATIAEEQELYAQQKLNRRAEQPIREALVEWLVALLETGQALLPVERAMCGQVLSLMGDSRKGVGTRKEMLKGREIEVPELEWCEITAPVSGKFVMGAESEKDNPRREEKLAYNYRMGKYQITYQQYQSFVDSGEYEQKEWWKGFPKEYQRQEISGQNNEYANHPRDSVSWYQTVAFTRWLTAKYQALGWLKKGEEIRLPTEGEWEYAAKGSDARKYPYGNEFDATKGNTSETGIGSTGAVGSFPDGASPYGVLDMSGNVSEWCLNKHDKPEQVQVDSSNDRRVLRGGSFLNYPDGASCVFRSFDNRNFFCGFRVAVVSAL